MAKLTTHSIGGEVLACACALFGAAGQAQTLNLPATLSSGAYAASSTVTNCTGTVSQANCTSVTLANNATVTLAAATQIVLGPGFTAVAGNASTSLVAAIVPAPTVSAVAVSPASVISGGSATITVTLSSNALYAVAVALTSSNTAAFNPPASITIAAGQISGSATVTAGTVSASTPVTVTGSYNSSSRQGSVTVLPPQILLTSVSVNPSSVISTNSATVTVTLSGVAPSGGAVVTLGSNNASAFNPPASITVAAGQTANFATVYSGTVSASTGVTVTGSYGGTQTGSVTVLPLPTVSAIAVTPSTVLSGGSVSVAVTLSAAAPASGAVVYLGSTNQTALNPPAGITVAAGQISGSVSVTAGTVSATASATVTGTYNGTSQSGPITVVPPPDFTITLTPTLNPATAMVGGSATFTVAVSPLNSFNGVVTLVATGLPTGASVTFSPATITGSGASTMTVTAPSSAGNIAVVATGTSGSLTHNASAVLAVQDFTFVLSPAYPSPVIVLPNGQTVVTAFTGGLNGFGQQGQTISFAYRQVSIGGLTPCALPQADWSNDYSSSTSVAPGQQATLLLQAGNANQYYCTFQVTASYGSTQHSQYGYLIQQGTGGFLLSAPAQQTVAAGQTATFPAAYTPYAGFNGNVTYSLSGQVPIGATASFTALSSPQLGSALNVYVPPGTLATTYGMMITASSPSGCTPGSSGCASQSVGAQLVVQSGLGFSITTTPVTSTTVAPGGTAQYNISVHSVGGYTGVVNLSTSGGPSAASVTLSAYSVQAGGAPVTLTIATTANTPLSTYATVVTATSGSVSQYGAAPLIVTLPAAASMLTPPPGANIAGGNTTFTWNAGLGATQYTVTAVTTNGQTSATTGPGQLNATLALPATSQTATVTLQTMTASGASTQYYSYTIQPSGTAQPLTLAAGNTMPTLVANGQEALYTFTYNSSGGARPSPQDIGDCISDEVAIRIRIANLTAGTAQIPGTATLGFTAPIGTPAAEFDWECNDGDGSGSGGGGTGTTGDPTPEIDSVSPNPIPAGAQTLTINGEYFGYSAGQVAVGGACTQPSDPTNWSSLGDYFQISVLVDPTLASYCTFVFTAQVDDDDDPFDPGDGASEESAPFIVPVEEPAAPPALHILSYSYITGITTDVTNSSQTVSIGQLIDLTADVQNATGTATYQWAQPPGNTGISWSATDGQSQGPKPMDAASLTTRNIFFAWTDITANAQCAQSGQCVQVTATIPGSAPLSATVQYNITAPQVTSVNQQYNSTLISMDCPNQGGILATCNLNPSTNPPYGITLAANPQINTSPPSVEWLQIATGKFDYFAGGGQCEENIMGRDGDAFLPMNGFIAYDAPGVVLANGFQMITVADSFSTYMMYEPTQYDMWVPLYRINWSWSAQAQPCATCANGWQLSTTSSGGPAPTAVSLQLPQQAATYPVWNQQAATSGVPCETVTAPNTPVGTTSGAVRAIYTYTTGGSTSSLNNPVQYQFTWGDGTVSGWLNVGVAGASHSWSSPGPYAVTAQARSAPNPTLLSPSSGALAVSMQ